MVICFFLNEFAGTQRPLEPGSVKKPYLRTRSVSPNTFWNVPQPKFERPLFELSFSSPIFLSVMVPTLSQ